MRSDRTPVSKEARRKETAFNLHRLKGYTSIVKLTGEIHERYFSLNYQKGK